MFLCPGGGAAVMVSVIAGDTDRGISDLSMPVSVRFLTGHALYGPMNVPDLYPEDQEVDQTSYCILLRLVEADDPLWKRELTRRLNDWRKGGLCPLNIDDPVNVQTVSRKVDALEEDGFIETVVTYPEDLGRYVEAFTVTEDGRAALEAVSDRIVEELLARYADRCARSETLSLAAGLPERLAENATMDIDTGTIEELEEEFRSRLDGAFEGRLSVEG
jgi:DNA-binding PadR family transcriptional regulator